MKKTILKGLLFGMFWGIGFLVIMIIGLVILKATDLSNVSDGEKIANTSWNTLLTKLNSAIGWSGPESLTAGTGDILTADKRNNLVTKVNTYTNIPDCAADNGGNCKITQSFKSELDADLAAGNIKSGVSVFGVNGSLPTYSNCAADNGGNCVIATASKSTLDTNLAAGNIKSGVSIFGVTGTLTGRRVYCRAIYGGTRTNYCEVGTNCYSRNGYNTDAYYTIYVSTTPNSIICGHTRGSSYQQYVYTSPGQFFSRGTVCDCYTE